MNSYKSTDRQNKWIIILKSTLLGLAVTLIFMIILSAVMLWCGISNSLAVPFATLSVSAGSFAAAFFASKKIGSKGYLTGLIAGIITFVIITALSLIVSGGGITYNTLFKFIIVVIASLIGGILGINIQRDKKYI